MKKTSIYPDRSQELLTLFEKAGNPSKLMCVPIDYAKKDHLVMFCNGNGEVLRKPFSVKNSVDGVKYLIDQVNRSCRRRQRAALIRNMEKWGTKKAEQVAAKLQEYAFQVLTTPDEYTATLQIFLSSHVATTAVFLMVLSNW